MRKKKQEERERALAEQLRAIVVGFEEKLRVEQSKVIELEGVVEIAMDTLKRGKRIQLESDGGAYLGLGGEFDTFRMVNLDHIENAENAWHRYLRRQGRDPEALQLCDQCGESPGTDRSHGPLLCADCAASSEGPL